MEISREFVQKVLMSLERNQPLINVITGPRQVGKTTGVKQVLEKFKNEHYYVSADGDLTKPSHWITEQWLRAKAKSPNAVLVIDEIQKVENWAEIIKLLWDQQDFKSDHLEPIRNPHMNPFS